MSVIFRFNTSKKCTIGNIQIKMIGFFIFLQNSKKRKIIKFKLKKKEIMK